MTSTEIVVSIIAGLFALYGLLMTLGCFYDRRKWEETLKAAKADAASEKLWAGRWRDEAQKQDNRRHELDQGVGRAICRIIHAHSDELRHRAQGMVKALNILEEETGRYKEEKEEAWPPVDKCVVCGAVATTHRWGQLRVELVDAPYRVKVTVNIGEYDYWKTRKPLHLCQVDADLLDRSGSGPVVFYLGKQPCTREQQIYVRQSQEADRQLRRDMARLRQEKDKARLQPTVPYPNGPPPERCKVCGWKGYTYRWGQVITTWFSGNNKETTRATVNWQNFDHNYDVGWFPVCGHHASVLDKHGTVNRTTRGHTPQGESRLLRESYPRPQGYHCG